MTDNGELKDYLGTRFGKNKKYGTITLAQPQFFLIVIDLVGLNYTSEKVKFCDTPACINNLLDHDPYGKPRVQKWNFRTVVGFLSYQNKMVIPYIIMFTKQCARFCNSPSRDHR